MLVEDQRWTARVRRPVAFTLVVLVVLVAPTWLWLVRGRRLPVRVLVSADRYVAAAGTAVALTARIMPAVRDVEIIWSGPGVSGQGNRARWALPQQPGVYTASLTVRRSGTVASDSVSVRTIAPPKDAAMVDAPALAPAPPTHLPPCQPPLPAKLATVHGAVCEGANIVVQRDVAAAQQVWFWWAHAPDAARRGPMANLRIGPVGDAARTLVVAVHDERRGCVHRTRQQIPGQPCRAGPSRHLFADFGWQLISPALFRLAAKPPRVAHEGRVSYRWSFGDGKRRDLSEPATVHRFRDGESQHLVTLEVHVGQHRVRAVKAVTDRTVQTAQPTRARPRRRD